MFTVYRKDMHNYFTTFVGYLFIAAVILIGGIYCYMYNFSYGYAGFEQSINYVPFFLILLIPVISAGIFTDEKRQKTEQLLYTMPLTSKQIVIGKYLALLTILLIPMLILGIYPIGMSFYGDVNLVAAYSNLFAIFMLGAALCAICMFISSLTESIVVSAVLCFGIMFVMYQIDSFASNLTGSSKSSYVGLIVIAGALLLFLWYMTKNIYLALLPSVIAFGVLSLIYKYSMTFVATKINLVQSNVAAFSKLDNFMNSVFDVTTIVYYLSIVVLFVLFTIYTFERKRWN